MVGPSVDDGATLRQAGVGGSLERLGSAGGQAGSARFCQKSSPGQIRRQVKHIAGSHEPWARPREPSGRGRRRRLALVSLPPGESPSQGSPGSRRVEWVLPRCAPKLRRRSRPARPEAARARARAARRPRARRARARVLMAPTKAPEGRGDPDGSRRRRSAPTSTDKRRRRRPPPPPVARLATVPRAALPGAGGLSLPPPVSVPAAEAAAASVRPTACWRRLRCRSRRRRKLASRAIPRRRRWGSTQRAAQS